MTMSSTQKAKFLLKHGGSIAKIAANYPKFANDAKYIWQQFEKNGVNEPYRKEAWQRYHFKEIALYLLVKKYKPKVIVETGVEHGVGTYFILKAIHENGTGELYSIDYPNYAGCKLPPGKSPGWLVSEKLQKERLACWHLIIGKSKDELPKLQLTEIDMFIHDSEHSYENMKFEFEFAIRKMRKGGIIASDDTRWNAAWDEFVKNNKLDHKRYPYEYAIMR